MPTAKDVFLGVGALGTMLLLLHLVIASSEYPLHANYPTSRFSWEHLSHMKAGKAFIGADHQLFRKDNTSVGASSTTSFAVTNSGSKSHLFCTEKLRRLANEITTLRNENERLVAKIRSMQVDLQQHVEREASVPISLTKLRELQAEVRTTAVQLQACTNVTRRRRQGAAGTAAATDEPSDEENFQHVHKFHQYRFPIEDDEPIPFIGIDASPVRGSDGECGTTFALALGVNKSIGTGDVSSCKYFDVVMHRPRENRCLMVVQQPCHWHNNPNDDEGQDEGFASSSLLSFEMDPSTKRPKLKLIDSEPSEMWAHHQRDRLLAPFLAHKPTMIGEVASRLSDVNNPVLVLCANDGHAALILNFFCNLETQGIAVPQHMVYASSGALRDKFESMGINAYYHQGLGKYPEDAAEVYGDRIFGTMMNLKQFSVQLTLEAGFSVLFQDADLVWLKNPMKDLINRSKYYHLQFMDDGARSFRFAPFFANTGFIFITHHHRSVEFWDHVTMSMAFGQLSGQEILDQVLDYHVRSRGVQVHILDRYQYVSGMHLDSDQEIKQKIPWSDVRILHFCWTHNIEVKAERMQQYGHKLIANPCFFGISKCGNVEALGKNWKELICEMPSPLTRTASHTLE